jgi:hypothetical protein
VREKTRTGSGQVCVHLEAGSTVVAPKAQFTVMVRGHSSPYEPQSTVRDSGLQFQVMTERCTVHKPERHSRNRSSHDDQDGELYDLHIAP